MSIIIALCALGSFFAGAALGVVVMAMVKIIELPQGSGQDDRDG